MFGWINWKPGGLPRIRNRVELLRGMPVCRVEIAGKAMPLLRLFLPREERILRQAGVREGAWADDLPECLHLGLIPVETAPLRRAMLPALLEQAFRQKRLSGTGASVRLTAEGTSLPVYWAAQLLAQRVRYLHLETGSGQEGLEDWLLQRYGLACGGGAPELEVTLRSAAEPRALLLGENCAVQRVEYILPPALADALPDGAEGEQLLTALWRQERLRPRELAVRRIYFSA